MTIKLLARKLPLEKYPRVKISKDVTLHHFGNFDSKLDVLDRPIWVSDSYEEASYYRQFGIQAPRYTKLVTKEPFEIVDLNGVRLQPIAQEMKCFEHSEWNKLLGEYITEMGEVGIVYAGREIFLAQPNIVISNMLSTAL